MRTSLITSVCNGDRWIDGFEHAVCTLKGNFEIVIVAVPQTARPTEKQRVRQVRKVKDMAERMTQAGVGVVLIEPRTRIGLYRAWNIAIRHASGSYIMPANIDDRFSPHIVTSLSNVLDRRDDVALVYASGYYTRSKDATWEKPKAWRCLEARPFDMDQFVRGCFIHPHPMWRKALHARCGMFDENLKSAGDYDFFMRVAAAGEAFAYLPEPHSLMYKGNDTLGNSQLPLSAAEANLVRARYARMTSHARWDDVARQRTQNTDRKRDG